MVLFGCRVAGFHTRLQSWLAAINGTFQERGYLEHTERHRQQQQQHQ